MDQTILLNNVYKEVIDTKHEKDVIDISDASSEEFDYTQEIKEQRKNKIQDYLIKKIRKGKI